MLLVLSLDFMIPGSRQVVYDSVAGGSHSYASMQLLVSVYHKYVCPFTEQCAAVQVTG
jgi:hypothetical protein